MGYFPWLDLSRRLANPGERTMVTKNRGGTFLGYRDENGNEMHCANAFCPDQTACSKGCVHPVAITRNSEQLASFVKYCTAHPTERFWQALRNWSEWAFVYVGDEPDPMAPVYDTFNWEENDG